MTDIRNIMSAVIMGISSEPATSKNMTSSVNIVAEMLLLIDKHVK